MGGVNAKISVALDKSLYSAGEVLRGYVQTEVLVDGADLPEISVTLLGSAHTKVRYTSGSGKNKTHKTATENHTLVKLDTKVGRVDTSLVTKGALLQWPFEFVIPADAVAGHFDKAKITYSVDVYATTPGVAWGTNTRCAHRVELDVVAAPPILTAPPRIQDDVKVMRCCCIPAGRMVVAASSSLSAYKAGDHPQVTFEVNNQSSQDVSYVEISLVRVVAWRARGHGSRTRSTIVSTRYAGVPIGAKFGFQDQEPGGGAAQVSPEEAARSVALEVPKLSHFSTSTPTITCSYELVVKIKTESGYVRDPTVILPISTYRLDPAAKAEVADAGGDDGDELIIASVVSIEYKPDMAITVYAVEVGNGGASSSSVLKLSAADVLVVPTEKTKG